MRPVTAPRRDHPPRLGLPAVLLSLVGCAALAGCAPTATHISPRQVAPTQAAIFGRLVILDKGKAVTARCEVVFTDQDEQEKTPHLPLDATGWVFATVAPGPTYLSSVLCDIPDTASSSGTYETRRLAFQAPGGGRITYFGYVRIDMQAEHQDRGAMFAAGMAMGLTRVVMPGGGYMPMPNAAAAAQSVPARELPAPGVAPMAGADVLAADVQNQFDLAVIEYQRRYGDDAPALRPEVAIAGAGGDAVGVLAERPAPVAALGFPLGQPPAAAEAACTGAGLAWQKVEGGGFSCSGAPAGLGQPMSVTLALCGDAVCEVSADAGADGAPWAGLVERFGQLTRRLAREHGAKHQRETRALAGCSAGPRGCTDGSRVRKSETWRWADQHRVTLVLDGGPVGGAPSLRIVYRVGEAPPAR